MEFTSTLEVSTNKLWGCHFRVPDLAVRLFSDNDRRVVCRINDVLEYQCAILPYGDGVYVISVNKAHLKKLGAREGAAVKVFLQKDESEYGLPIADELKEVLAQDEAGNRVFHALTPGKIRTLLHIVNETKKPELRLAKSIVILEHLKENGGALDYKQLHQAFKADNLKKYL